MPRARLPELAEVAAGVPERVAVRSVYLERETGAVDCSIYRRADLLVGHHLTGPAIITQRDSTTVVLAGQVAEIAGSRRHPHPKIRRRLTAMDECIDPINRDVFQSQVHGIAGEMSVALRRASFSSIIWDMYDYSCGLFTPVGDMIAQADTIPAQLGIMSTAIRYLFHEYPLETWRPGRCAGVQ